MVEQGFRFGVSHYPQFMPSFFDRLIIPRQKISICVNVICNGSPSRIRMVRRISFGMTTRPRSSILLTIPVAFIYTKISLLYNFVLLVSVKQGDLYLLLNFILQRKIYRFPLRTFRHNCPLPRGWSVFCNRQKRPCRCL